MESAIVLFLVVLLQIVTVYSQNDITESIYEFTAKDIQGMETQLSNYRGKVLLIVNVASECGYTDNHYRELVELQNIFNDGSFHVLAFPCNQFGAQEPKRNSAIERFAKENYNVNFKMFSKIKTIGNNAHPLYQWLKTATGEEPNWNFCKYLINKDGKVVKFAFSHISPMGMYNDIEKLVIEDEGGAGKQHNEL